MGSEVKGKRRPTIVLKTGQKVRQRKLGFTPVKHEELLEEGLRDYAAIWASLAKK